VSIADELAGRFAGSYLDRRVESVAAIDVVALHASLETGDLRSFEDALDSEAGRTLVYALGDVLAPIALPDGTATPLIAALDPSAIVAAAAAYTPGQPTVLRTDQDHEDVAERLEHAGFVRDGRVLVDEGAVGGVIRHAEPSVVGVAAGLVAWGHDVAEVEAILDGAGGVDADIVAALELVDEPLAAAGVASGCPERFAVGWDPSARTGTVALVFADAQEAAAAQPSPSLFARREGLFTQSLPRPEGEVVVIELSNERESPLSPVSFVHATDTIGSDTLYATCT
jgi:hypothetical protein